MKEGKLTAEKIENILGQKEANQEPKYYNVSTLKKNNNFL